MTKKNKVNTASGQATKIQEALNELYKNDNEDADIDIDVYGADDSDEAGSYDLDGADDTVDIGDIDDSDISDDDDQVHGQDVSGDDELDGEFDGDEDEGAVDADPREVIDQLEDLLNQLKASLGEDDEDGESEGDELETEDQLFDPETEEELEEEADPSSWNGKMQTLKVPSGQDKTQKTAIDNPTVAKGSQKAKALPSGKKPTGQEGNTDYKEVLKKTSDAGKAGPRADVPKAQAIIDVVNKMLASDTKTIQALYKGNTKLKTMESLDFDMSDAANKIAKAEGLSEEATQIAADLFTAKLKERVEEAIEIIDAQYAISLAESLEEINRREDELVEKLDEYLGYVTESYFEENKVALEEGVASELTESFMDGLRGLFEEHYIEVPKGKTNVIEKLQAELDETKTKLQETVNKAIKFRNTARSLKREKLVTEATTGMSLNEAANFKKLVEDVEYNGDDENFNKRIKRLKEAHFGKRKVTQTPHEFETLAEDTNKPTSQMEKYLRASKTIG